MAIVYFEALSMRRRSSSLIALSAEAASSISILLFLSPSIIYACKSSNSSINKASGSAFSPYASVTFPLTLYIVYFIT